MSILLWSQQTISWLSVIDGFSTLQDASTFYVAQIVPSRYTSLEKGSARLPSVLFPPRTGMPAHKLVSAVQLSITRFWRVLFLLMLLLLHVVALRGAEDFWAR